jgi:hypothetical protein
MSAASTTTDEVRAVFNAHKLLMFRFSGSNWDAFNKALYALYCKEGLNNEAE